MPSTGKNDQSVSRHDYIDALRGYAILGVFVVHTSQSVGGLNKYIQMLANDGARGVQLFFVASALTLTASWHRRQDGVSAFFVRRLFRIAPMFWLAILLNMLAFGFGPRYWAPLGISWSDVGLTSIFLHGGHPRSINSVVPGGWSITVEMTFYLIFPFAMFGIRNMRAAILVFLASLFVNYFFVYSSFTTEFRGVLESILEEEEYYLIPSFVYLWLPSQIPVFAIGIGVFFALRDFKWRWPIKYLRILTAVFLILLLARPFTPVGALNGFLDRHVQFAILFGGVAYALGNGIFKPIAFPAIIFLGKVSYSAYLLHFVVISAVSLYARPFLKALEPISYDLIFLIILVLTICSTSALAWVTLQLIETPAITLGRRTVNYLAQNRPNGGV